MTGGIHIQIKRYTIIGLALNVSIYLLYLLLTHFGLGPKTAMSALYVSGVIASFHFNRTWTFAHKGHVTKALIGYFSIYAIGYLLNLFALHLLVDKFGYAHQWVQGTMIFLLAILLFSLQKFLVFRRT